MSLGLGVEIDTLPRKADLGLLHLLEILRQQLGYTPLIVAVGLAEFDRQQTDFGYPPIARGVSNHRAATVQQPADQAPGLAKDIAHALFMPIERAIKAAYERGEIRMVNVLVAAVTFVAAIESLHEIHRYTQVPRDALAIDLIDVTLVGLRRR